MNSNTMNPILQLRDLKTRFYTPEGVVHAVNGVSFDLHEGETIGVVGESGCGKSVTMMSALRLIPTPPGKVENGEALFKGKDLLKMSDHEIRDIRGAEISMIFQDPITCLNPVFNIYDQVSEPLIRHFNMDRKDAERRTIELLEMVGIPEAANRLKDYPHQFSGGMRQRVMIAMALACEPSVLIADEPTTALDVTIQAQIIDLIRNLRDTLGMAIIWITHDLGVVAGIARRVLVMYGGFVIEDVLVDDLYTHPLHPYTIGLLSSLPRLDRASRQQTLQTIAGSPPLLYHQPVACPFRPRCKFAVDRCAMNPSLMDVGPDHRVACWIDPETGRMRA